MHLASENIIIKPTSCATRQRDGMEMKREMKLLVRIVGDIQRDTVGVVKKEGKIEADPQNGATSSSIFSSHVYSPSFSCSSLHQQQQVSTSIVTKIHTWCTFLSSVLSIFHPARWLERWRHYYSSVHSFSVTIASSFAPLFSISIWAEMCSKLLWWSGTSLIFQTRRTEYHRSV